MAEEHGGDEPRAPARRGGAVPRAGSRPGDAIGLVFLGLLCGVLVLLFGLWLYLRVARVNEAREAIGEQLKLPPEAFELEELDSRGELRISLKEVALIGERGDTIAAAPVVTMRFVPASLAGSGPYLFTDVELRRPVVHLVQTPAGEWNVLRAFKVTASGNEVRLPEEAGRAVVLRDLRIVDGRGTVAMPGAPADTAGFASRVVLPPLRRMGGVTYRVYTLQAVNGRLPMVRFGGTRGWRAEVGSLTARLAEPGVRIAQLRGWAEAVGEDGVRFSLQTLRTGGSALSGSGVVRFADAGTRYDVQLRAQPLLLADLRPFLPTLPAEGTASFALALQTQPDGRTRLAVRDLQLAAGDSRASGHLTLTAGGTGAPAFGETRLELEPLDLRTLEQLGLLDSLPVLGQVRGTLATDAGAEGALRVALAAHLVPRDQPGADPSVVTADGALALAGGEGEGPVRLEGVRVELQPLHLSTLAALLPEQRERLRGDVRGVVTVSGTPRALTWEGGELGYQVGNSAPTRLVGLAGHLSLDPALRYEVTATAQPLALATLSELVPALPFRAATLAGPIRVAGSADSVAFSADLRGSAGGIRLAGTALPGDPLRFDVSGRVEAFNASAILTAGLPVEGGLTGTFAARGAADDFRFNVDLAQTAGQFVMEGRVRLPGGPPQFEVTGRASDFRLGALVGQPALFASPLTGTFGVRGGGRQEYVFNSDLRGAGALLSLQGSYTAGDVPTYRAVGQVAGLNLRRLPLGPALPETNLTASLNVQGRGVTLETLEGSYALEARSSTVAGIPLDAATVRARAENGVLVVDTLVVALRDARLAASGMWGLTQPAPQPLRYALVASNLATLSRVIATVSPQRIQPQMAGSLQVEGTVAGSVRYPAISASLRGRGLRYEEWQAGTLDATAQVSRLPGIGWGGQATLDGTSLALAGGQTLQSLRFEARGNQGTLGVSLAARRDPDTDLSLAGVVELEGQTPRAVVLDTLALRLGDTDWRLAGRTRLVWSGNEGLDVQELRLVRAGPAPGLIEVDGLVPPTGRADLTVRARGVDLADLHRISASAPDMQGVLTLDALLQGPVTDPEMRLQLRVDSLRYQGAAADLITLDANYLGQRLATSAQLWVGGGQIALAEGSLPMQLSLADLIPDFELRTAEPLDARVVVDSLPLDLLSALTPQLQQGAGVARAQVVVGGTLDRPALTGWAQVYDGALRVIPLGVRFTDLQALLTLEQNRVRIDTLTARSEGTASLNGLITFEERSGPRVTLEANLDRFRVMDRSDLASLRTSGRIALTGQFPAPVLTGRLVFDESTIAIPELNQQTGTEITDVEVGQLGADTASAGGFGPAFLQQMRVEALEVAVGDGVWLSSNDARVQIGGDLVVYRTGPDLRVYGLLNALRGTYTLRVGSLTREFDIQRGRVQFFGTPDLNPSLDIVAAHRVRTGQAGGTDILTILVNVTGTLLSPRIQLSSDTPTPLSESDLFSYLIFGRPSFELGGAAGTLAEQLLLQELVGGLVATGLERPLLQAGICDYVRVLPGVSTLSGIVSAPNISTALRSTVGAAVSSVGTAVVECGRELASDVFFTLETGIGALFGDVQSWSAGLEWQINPELMWDLAYGTVRQDPLLLLVNPTTRYQLSTDLRRRWEYGRSHPENPVEIGPPSTLPGEVAPPDR